MNEKVFLVFPFDPHLIGVWFEHCGTVVPAGETDHQPGPCWRRIRFDFPRESPECNRIYTEVMVSQGIQGSEPQDLGHIPVDRCVRHQAGGAVISGVEYSQEHIITGMPRCGEPDKRFLRDDLCYG